MTLINRLIREARDGATVLDIRLRDVGPVAEHMRVIRYKMPNVELCRDAILAGEVLFWGVPLRVLGKGSVDHFGAGR